jgi:hypothetical protein
MLKLDPNIWEPDLVSGAQRAVRRAVAQFQNRVPLLADSALSWLATHCDVDHPEDYFLHPQALPLLSLPWWLERSLQGTVDEEFQADLIESSVNLYYFARMLDDLMDGHATERAALPALYPFLLGFQGVYFGYFIPADDFWGHFQRQMDLTAESASVDSALQELNEDDFLNMAARKTAAAFVPVAAVCCRYGRQDVLAAWEDYFLAFARWHQFRNDLLGWSGDTEREGRTWLLCEAERRKGAGESVAMWMGREGFAWAGAKLKALMEDAVAKASTLGSPELMLYLAMREEHCAREVSFLRKSAAAWAGLLELDAQTPHR